MYNNFSDIKKYRKALSKTDNTMKNIITNNSIGFKGYTISDAIVMQNDTKDIHYYAYFNDENIELWYITGVYDMVISDGLKFNDLLFFLQA